MSRPSAITDARARAAAAGATKSPWASAAFIVESILLLLFLAASLAVLLQVFTTALARSYDGRVSDAAVVAATQAAERFAADPSSAATVTQDGDLLVMCKTHADKRDSGTMYYAHIDVYDIGARHVAVVDEAGDVASGNLVYSLDTSTYRHKG